MQNLKIKKKNQAIRFYALFFKKIPQNQKLLQIPETYIIKIPVFDNFSICTVYIIWYFI